MEPTVEASVATVNEKKTFIEIDNVHISPPKLVFHKVFVGKALSGKFFIRNEGKSKAFVRIPPVNEKDFEVDAIPRGVIIRPGLKIIKTVNITFVDINCLRYIIPIFINNHNIDYEVIVKLACARISYTPSNVDFGIIDEGAISDHRTIVITNDGDTIMPFQIDVGKSKGHMIMEPNRGIIQANSKVTIKIKLLPLGIGDLRNTLVIKCDKLLRIPITATVIVSQLEAIHPRACKYFTLVYFTPTYFGLKQTQNLLIRNYSAVSCMFVTTGEYEEESIDIEELPIKNPDYKAFKISSLDGTMQPHETKQFCLTFSPTADINKKGKHFYFSTVVIHKIRCNYLQNDFIGPELYAKTPDTSHSYKGSLLSLATMCSMPSHRSIESEPSFRTDVEAQAYYKSQKSSEKDMVRIHLCGEAEIASVEVVPDELYIDNLRMQQVEIRVLELKNLSKNLPIFVCYKKVPFVRLDKSKISLKPLESKQVAVTIIPYQLGTISTKIVFELMYYNQPKEAPLSEVGSISVKITLNVNSATCYPKPQINRGLDPNYIREVGKNCQDLRFSSSLDNVKAVTVDTRRHLDVDCTDLVALPNERTRSLRPWRSNIPCCTIFTHQPRYIPPIDTEYEQTQNEQDFHKRVTTYYNKYIGIGQNKPNLSVSMDGDVLRQQKKSVSLKIDCMVTSVEIKPTHIEDQFLPLTLQQMKKIITLSECIRTGAIAANHSVIFPLRIENWNNFQIRLYIRPNKSNIGCIRDNRHILYPQSCIAVKLVYLAGNIGYYSGIIDLIFNESFMIPVSVIANVVPKVIRISTTELVFDENCTHKYIELTNNLNIPVKFFWVMEHTNFHIQPSDGVVEFNSKMICVVYYFPEIEGPTESVVKFVSGECTNQSVVLKVKKINRKLEIISKEVNFENIPLLKVCISSVVIKNPCTIPVSFKIDRSDLKLSWIKIFPMQAVLHANSKFSLMVTVVCPKCVIFQATVKILIVNTDLQLEFTIRGNSVYPDVQVNPNPIHIPKSVSNTHSSVKFTMNNNCPVLTNIKFVMQEYEEFRITETPQFWDKIVDRSLTFNPYEQKVFYLHFSPTEAMSTWFYLPFIINTTLGPPLRYDTITQLVDYYVKDHEDPGDHLEYISVPSKLPCVKVTALSWAPKIVFSKMKIELKAELMDKTTSYILKISNPQNETEIVFIKMDSLTSPFSYFVEELASVKKISNTLSFKLEPQEEAEVVIIYEPQSFGKSRAFLPVYLQNADPNEMHTVIEIVGIYQKPQISVSPRYIELIENISGTVAQKATINTSNNFSMYCGPLPENVATYDLFEVVFKGHNQDCKLSFNFEGNAKLTISEHSERNWVNERDYTVYLKFACPPHASTMYTGYWQISCSCGGFWRRPTIGSYENSFVTNCPFSAIYFKKLVNKEDPLILKTSSRILLAPPSDFEENSLFDFWELYPLFPSKTDTLVTYMEGCIYAMEMWIFNQGLFQETYYAIPYCINKIYTVESKDKRQKSGPPFPQIPYIQLLTNMIGDQVKVYFGLDDFPSNQCDQVNYMYTIFNKAVELLKERGGIFTYISPEFLLPFNYFEIYKRTLVHNRHSILPLAMWSETVEEFHLLAKQTWLDFLLQTYKVFYLQRLPIGNKNNRAYIQPLEEFFNALPKLCLRNLHIHSKTEQVILAWFQYHYDQNSVSMWQEQKLPCKLISIAGDCFIDGLVFAVVTSVYCPYLVPQLGNICIRPETLEDYTHNLLTVIQCWETLNYSFDIKVDEMLKPHSLRLMMLLAYLYDVLPSLYPSETMAFKAGLSLATTKSLKISNPNNYSIAYKPILIPDNTIFTITQKMVVVPPKKTIDLQIIYNAKFAKEYTCALVLNGEIRKYHYAKNKCIYLIGTSDLTHPSTIITHPVYIYEIIDIDLMIQSPYKVPCSYNLRQSQDPLKDYEQLQELPEHRDVLRFRVTITNDVFITNNAGIMSLCGILRCLFSEDQSCYLYFLNPDVGDFMVKINTRWCDNYKSEIINVTLSEEFCENPEVYSERHRMVINLPLQNKAVWDMLTQLTCRLVDEKDRTSWKNILDIPAGRLIALKLYNLSKNMAPCARDNEKSPLIYKISGNKDCNIILPSEVVISNEYEEGIVEVEFKLKPGQRWPNNFVMVLTDHLLGKLRRYKVIFLYDHKVANKESQIPVVSMHK